MEKILEWNGSRWKWKYWKNLTTLFAIPTVIVLSWIVEGATTYWLVYGRPKPLAQILSIIGGMVVASAICWIGYHCYADYKFLSPAFRVRHPLLSKIPYPAIVFSGLLPGSVIGGTFIARLTDRPKFPALACILGTEFARLILYAVGLASILPHFGRNPWLP